MLLELISKENRRAEHEYINMHSLVVNALVSALFDLKNPENCIVLLS